MKLTIHIDDDMDVWTRANEIQRAALAVGAAVRVQRDDAAAIPPAPAAVGDAVGQTRRESGETPPFDHQHTEMAASTQGVIQ